MRISRCLVPVLGGLWGGLAIGCTEDPLYLQPVAGYEYDPALFGGDPPPPAPPAISLIVPLEIETTEERAERDALTASVGVQVPYARLDDLLVSLEWTLKNLEPQEGVAFLTVNGGNELNVLDLSSYFLEDEDTPPALMGGSPIHVPANSQRSGVFREDQIVEASIDVDLISRGNMPPLQAILNVHEDIASFQPMTQSTDPDVPPVPMGTPIPRIAIPLMTQFDVSMRSTTRMILEFVVRVRDRRGIAHPMGMAAPEPERQPHAPATYAPPPPAD